MQENCNKVHPHPLTQDTIGSSGVARAFPGGRLAHPENQNEEKNK